MTDSDNPAQNPPTGVPEAEVDAKIPTTDSEATAKPDGLGEDGTIPADPNGVAAGHSDTASHFNPEEDEDAS